MGHAALSDIDDPHTMDRMVDQLSRKRRLTQVGAFVFVALAGGGCDMQTKSWAENNLSARPGRSMTIIEPWLEFKLAYNRGTAFSFIPDLGDARWLFGILAFVIVLALLVAAARTRQDRFQLIALGAIAGGAVGNGVDRLLSSFPGERAGVVDFIRLNYPWGGSWPAFNVADILVTVGTIALLLSTFFRRDPNAEVSSEGPDPLPQPNG